MGFSPVVSRREASLATCRWIFIKGILTGVAIFVGKEGFVLCGQLWEFIHFYTVLSSKRQRQDKNQGSSVVNQNFFTSIVHEEDKTESCFYCRDRAVGITSCPTSTTLQLIMATDQRRACLQLLMFSLYISSFCSIFDNFAARLIAGSEFALFSKYQEKHQTKAMPCELRSSCDRDQCTIGLWQTFLKRFKPHNVPQTNQSLRI